MWSRCPIRSARKPISENTLNIALRAMGYAADEMTSHGFRAMASTLLNESGKWNPDAIERALAHGDSDTVRGAYRWTPQRGHVFGLEGRRQQRRRLELVRAGMSNVAVALRDDPQFRVGDRDEASQSSVTTIGPSSCIWDHEGAFIWGDRQIGIATQLAIDKMH